MDTTPVAGIDELDAHLDQLVDAPETVLNIKLFDDVELQLTDANTSPLIPRILPRLITVLSTTPHQPDPIVSLAIRLLRPMTFTQVMTLADEESLITALRSPAQSANLLALNVIQKASRTPSEAAILSSMQRLVRTFVTIWLSSPSVEVGEAAGRAITSMLETDCAVQSTSNATLNVTMKGDNVSLRPQIGQGLLWRRIFQDHEIYSTIFVLCSHHTMQSENEAAEERQKSLAQGRLLRVIPHLMALDFSAITRSHFPDVEAQFGLTSPAQQSILYFAIFNMVDKSDVLMHITLLDFLRELLDTLAAGGLTEDKLTYLKVLMVRAARVDDGVAEMVNGLRNSPATSDELAELLSRLSI